MHTMLHLVFGEEQVSSLFYTLVDTSACFLLWLALHAARRAQNERMAYCLAPLLLGFVCDWINNTPSTLYRLLNGYEPEPFNSITDLIEDAGMVFIAVGAYRFWKMLQGAAVSAPTFPDYGPAEPGVWPPPPQKPAE